MRTVDPRTGIEVLDYAECMRLLASKQVGRIGFAIWGGPEILPVNYVLDHDAIVFATGAGSKLSAVVRSPVVFEVDDTDDRTRTGWSVVMHGLAQEVTAADNGTLERVLALPLEPWSAGRKPYYVRITPRFVSGRRVGAAGSASPTPPG
ncbi:MAG TPA: pyridoxamine 5'-phosphate oxidase family protein [Acidimicrobiales bacterium]|nr:pyridoxamine 5'-phosphate oxidase family protein [Acidimicrobiales bacterium]